MRFLSGIQPSGNITLGNYIGAVKQFVKLQDHPDFTDFIVFIADMHAITVPQEKQTLRKSIRSLAAIYLACGLNPEKVHIFIQSEVAEHAELAWVLECNSYIGELERMTQFKDKKEKQVQGVSAGLLTYPSLMAADILLYDADVVPVGKDQKQHLELTRTLAERFNNKYGETFVVPEPFFPQTGAKIMSLTEPEKKMSKSDPNPKAFISLLDEIPVIKKKIKSAVTDSDGVIKFDPDNKPGISNLLTILSCCTNTPIEELVEKYKDSNYATFKEDVANAVVAELEPIQKRYYEIIDSPMLDSVLDSGRDYAKYLAQRKLSKVYNKVGLGRKR
ncbi:tryptophanyl-tRNA synthetase [Anaeroplasma bactoclasticum]|jgi:tryptophanyl-tRNA synthetase|uniref:Tryptophan--tRNA ligase n=1 Tax=Anaeroplasma bactoclasticum TaxID=2088 RepID=A0A397RVV5_9MOLU|nr:tryptophan--tRNA ligase [Anaeroplasma bactoclasticum]RIA75767.1 tryptophanyl-tRNA synthetase [Anaeroplasma bactoclasticum]